jgi:hypothetical protein
VTALDRNVIQPVIGAGVSAAVPYLLKYMGPPLFVLYAMTGASMWFSYQVLKTQRSGVSKNSRRRGRRQRAR